MAKEKAFIGDCCSIAGLKFLKALSWWVKIDPRDASEGGAQVEGREQSIQSEEWLEPAYLDMIGNRGDSTNEPAPAEARDSDLACSSNVSLSQRTLPRHLFIPL